LTEVYLIPAEIVEEIAPKETGTLNLETAVEEGAVEVVLLEDTAVLAADTCTKAFEPESDTCISEMLPMPDECDERKPYPAGIQLEIESSYAQSVIERHIGESESISKSAEHGDQYTGYTAEGELSLTEVYLIPAEIVEELAPKGAQAGKLNLETAVEEGVVEVVLLEDTAVLSTDTGSKAFERESDSCTSEILPLHDECDEWKREPAGLQEYIEASIAQRVVGRHFDESKIMSKSAEHGADYTDFKVQAEPCTTEGYVITAEFVATIQPEETDTQDLETAASCGVVELESLQATELLSKDTFRKAFVSESRSSISEILLLQDECVERKGDPAKLQRELEPSSSQIVVGRHIEESESISKFAEYGAECTGYTAEGEFYVTEAPVDIVETHASEKTVTLNLEPEAEESVGEVGSLEHTVVLSQDRVSKSFEPEFDTCISESLPLKDEGAERKHDSAEPQGEIEAAITQSVVVRRRDESESVSKSTEHGADYTAYPAEGEASVTKNYLIPVEILKAFAPEETYSMNIETEGEECVVQVVSTEDTVVLLTDTFNKSFEPEFVTCISENMPLDDDDDERKCDPAELQGEIEAAIAQSVVVRRSDESESVSKSTELGADYTAYTANEEPSVTEAYLIPVEIVKAFAPEENYKLNMETADEEGVVEVVPTEDTVLMSTNTVSKAFETESQTCISEMLPLQDECDERKRDPAGRQGNIEPSIAQGVFERHIQKSESMSKSAEHGAEYTKYTADAIQSSTEVFLIPAEIVATIPPEVTDMLNLRTPGEVGVMEVVTLEPTEVLSTDTICKAFEGQDYSCISEILPLQNECDEWTRRPAGLEGAIEASIAQSVFERHIDESGIMSKSAEHGSEYTKYTAEVKMPVTETSAEIEEALAPEETGTLNLETAAEGGFLEMVSPQDTVVLSADAASKPFEPESDTCISENLPLQDECDERKSDPAELQGELKAFIAQSVVDRQTDESESMSKSAEHGAECIVYSAEVEMSVTEAPAETVKALAAEETGTLNLETAAEEAEEKVVSPKNMVVLSTDTVSKPLETECDTCISEIVPLQDECDERKPAPADLQGEIEASIAQSIVERHSDESESISKSAEHGAECTDYTADGEPPVTEACLIPAENLEALVPGEIYTLNLDTAPAARVVEVASLEDTEVLSTDTVSKAFEFESDTCISEILPSQDECDERKPEPSGLQEEIEACIQQSVFERRIDESEYVSKFAEHGAEYTDYTAERQLSVTKAYLITVENLEAIAPEGTDTLYLESAPAEGVLEVVSPEYTVVLSTDTVSKTFEPETDGFIYEILPFQDECDEKKRDSTRFRGEIEVSIAQSVVAEHIDESESMSQSADHGTEYTDYTSEKEPSVTEGYLITAEIEEAPSPEIAHTLNLEPAVEACVMELVSLEETFVASTDTCSKTFEPESDTSISETMHLRDECDEKKLDPAGHLEWIETSIAGSVVERHFAESEIVSKSAEHGAQCIDYTAEEQLPVTEDYLITAENIEAFAQEETNVMNVETVAEEGVVEVSSPEDTEILSTDMVRKAFEPESDTCISENFPSQNECDERKNGRAVHHGEIAASTQSFVARHIHESEIMSKSAEHGSECTDYTAEEQLPVTEDNLITAENVEALAQEESNMLNVETAAKEGVMEVVSLQDTEELSTHMVSKAFEPEPDTCISENLPSRNECDERRHDHTGHHGEIEASTEGVVEQHIDECGIMSKSAEHGSKCTDYTAEEQLPVTEDYLITAEYVEELALEDTDRLNKESAPAEVALKVFSLKDSVILSIDKVKAFERESDTCISEILPLQDKCDGMEHDTAGHQEEIEASIGQSIVEWHGDKSESMSKSAVHGAEYTYYTAEGEPSVSGAYLIPAEIVEALAPEVTDTLNMEPAGEAGVAELLSLEETIVLSTDTGSKSFEPESDIRISEIMPFRDESDEKKIDPSGHLGWIEASIARGVVERHIDESEIMSKSAEHGAERTGYNAEGQLPVTEDYLLTAENVETLAQKESNMPNVETAAEEGVMEDVSLEDTKVLSTDMVSKAFEPESDTCISENLPSQNEFDERKHDHAGHHREMEASTERVVEQHIDERGIMSKSAEHGYECTDYTAEEQLPVTEDYLITAEYVEALALEETDTLNLESAPAEVALEVLSLKDTVIFSTDTVKAFELESGMCISEILPLQNKCDGREHDTAGHQEEIEVSIAQSVVGWHRDESESMSKSAEHGAEYTYYTAEGEPSVSGAYLIPAEIVEALPPEVTDTLNLEPAGEAGVVELLSLEGTIALSTDTGSKAFEPLSDICSSEVMPFRDESYEKKIDPSGHLGWIETSIARSVVERHIDESEMMSKSADHGAECIDYTTEEHLPVREDYLITAENVETQAEEETDMMNMENVFNEGVVVVASLEETEVFSTDIVSKAFEPVSDTCIYEILPSQKECDGRRHSSEGHHGEIEASTQSFVARHIDESETMSKSAEHETECTDYTVEGQLPLTEDYLITAENVETLAQEETKMLIVETVVEESVVEVVSLGDKEVLSTDMVSKAFEPESDTCISEILPSQNECDERKHDHAGHHGETEASTERVVERQFDEIEIMSKSAEHGSECTDYTAEEHLPVTEDSLITAEYVEALALEETDMLNLESAPAEVALEVLSLKDTVILSTVMVKAFEPESDTCISEILPLQDKFDGREHDTAGPQEEIEASIAQSVVEWHRDESEIMSKSAKHGAEYTYYTAEGEPSISGAYLLPAEIVDALAPEVTDTLNLEPAGEAGVVELLSLEETIALSTDTGSKAFEPQSGICISEIMPFRDECDEKKRDSSGHLGWIETSIARSVVEQHIGESESISKSAEHGAECTDYTAEEQLPVTEDYLITAENVEAQAEEETDMRNLESVVDECVMGVVPLEDAEVLSTDMVSKAFEPKSDACISEILPSQNESGERKHDSAFHQGELEASNPSVVARKIDQSEIISECAEHIDEYTDYTAEEELPMTQGYLITAQNVEAFAPDQPGTLKPKIAPAEGVLEVLSLEDTIILSTDMVSKAFEPEFDTCISEILPLQDECVGREHDTVGHQGEIEAFVAQSVVEWHTDESESTSKSAEHGAEYTDYPAEGDPFLTGSYSIPAEIVEALAPELTGTLNRETAAEKDIVPEVSLEATVALSTDTVSNSLEPESDTCISEMMHFKDECDEKKHDPAGLQGEIEFSIAQKVFERHIYKSDSMLKSAEHGAEYTDYTEEGEPSVIGADLLSDEIVEALAPEATDTLNLEPAALDGVEEVVSHEDLPIQGVISEPETQNIFVAPHAEVVFNKSYPAGDSELHEASQFEALEGLESGFSCLMDEKIFVSVVERSVSEHSFMKEQEPSKNAPQGVSVNDRSISVREGAYVNSEIIVEEKLHTEEQFSKLHVYDSHINKPEKTADVMSVAQKSVHLGSKDSVIEEQVCASFEVIKVDMCEDMGGVMGGSIKHEKPIQEIELELEQERVFVTRTEDIVPLDQDRNFQEKEATRMCIGKESVVDISTKPYDHDYERKLPKGKTFVRGQEHVLQTEIPYFLGNVFEMETDAAAMVDVRKLHGEEEALLDKDTANSISTDVTSVLEETLLQNDIKGELDSEDCFEGYRDQQQSEIFGNGVEVQENSLRQIYAAEMSVFGESKGRELEACEIISTGEKVMDETGVKEELCVEMPTVGSDATDVPFLYREDKDDNRVPVDESGIFKTEDSFISYVVAEVETSGEIRAEGIQARDVGEYIEKFHVKRHVEGFEEDVFKDEARERRVGISSEEEKEEEASSSSKEFERELNAARRKSAHREAASIKPHSEVEVEKCDLGEEVCEAGVIGPRTQETETEVNRTEGKATKLLLVDQEYCDLETLAGVKDVSAVFSQQNLMTKKSKEEKEVVETTECADSEACIGLSASSKSKSDSSLVTIGHQVRLPRDSQSVTEHLSASYLVQKGPHYFVPCRNKDEEEILFKPEVQKTIVGLESQFVERTSREDVDDAKIRDSAEETASKSESRIFDDTQTNLLPSEAVVPFLCSSNIPQFSKICDTSDGKGRVTRKPRQQRLVIDTNVAETEVKELICEVREVTRQIKQEVREMKPDLTPTPEGKESSIIPISDSREFVELTDLGCIKEEQIVLDLGNEIIKYPDPFFAIDASSGTASSATLSGTERGGGCSYPRSRDDLLQAKANRLAVDSEGSVTLPDPSNTVPIACTSQEVQQTLSASVRRVTGRNINNALNAPDTIVETSTREMPVQDREVDFIPDTSIIEELVPSVSDTFTELSELTANETPDEKGGILDKSSGSLIENVTQSEVVLDFVAPAFPVGIVATCVSAEVSDKLNEPLHGIERGCHPDGAPAILSDVEKHRMEESVTEFTSRCEEGLFVQGTGPSDVAEAESVVIESIAERGLQETERMSQDPEPSVAVEGKYISHVPFEDRRRLQEMEPSDVVEVVTPVISDVILEDVVSISEKFESSVDIVPADFIEVSQPDSQLQSGDSSLSEQHLYSTEENAEISTETSNWEMNSNSGFQVSQDDIVMEDDLLEVTVTTEKSSDFGSEGKLFTTETGTTYFEFESGTTRSICVCEEVISSQPVTLHAPGPSVNHRAEKVALDTTQDKSSAQKKSITSKSKTKSSEKQVQSDSSSLKSRRDPKPIATMKKLDDHMTAFRSPKETDKCSQVTQVPSDGTVHRYRGYMASTLSRDLKVERTVAERTSYISRDSPVKRRVITEREDSSSTTSPSKLSTGAVPKPPQTVKKSKRVRSTSASSEKNIQETTKHSYVPKHTMSTTSAVTARSVVATEEELIANLTNAGSSTNTAAHQKRPVTRDLPSSSSVRQARLSSTFKKSLPESEVSQGCGGKIKRSEQTKVCGTVEEQRKASPVRGKGRKLIEAVPDTTLKVTAKKRAPKLESPIEMDRQDILKATDSTEVTKTDGTAVMPVSSRAGILAPAEQDMTTPHSHVTYLKETATAPTFSLLSHVPSPDSSPSIKSILDKWSAVASERRSSRAPSPSPSASPVRAATSASRSTERVDFSTHTPSSLPSSPSRMVRQTTSQSGVTQILTSEVFTRTVDTSGSIEVIYRQPNSSEAVRRVAVVGGSRSSLHETVPGYGGTGTEGEVSLIDTTDSSLSDSVALPSSSSDHELSMEMRLRTGVSPASPKPTSRSLDLIHDVTGPKLLTSDFMLDYCAVPFVADSEQLAPDSSVLRLEGSSATVPLDAVPKTRTCTQVSEERLSPILDVCAVTPPRVKHKFQYEEDEEGEEDEAVAAFLSSPGNTDDLPSAPTFHSTLAAAASVQSMASELDLRFCEVHMNVGSDSHRDSESGKPSLDNLLSKTSYSKQFVNCERFEGKFGTGCSRYDEIYGVEFNVPKSQVIPYFSEGKPGILSDLQLAAVYVSVKSDPQIIQDQFSETGSYVEDSIPIKEVVYKQEPQTRGVAKFNLATDLSVNLLNEDEDILDMGEEDIHTLSTSGSEVDYAVVESSSNPLAMIEEEAAEATDEDQDIIPVDDIPVKMGNLDPGEINRHCLITSQSDCMSEQSPVFLNSVNNMAFNHDSLPLLSVMPDDGTNSDVLIRRPYKSVPVVSVDDGYVHLDCSEMCDGDDEGDIISCPETSTPFGNMLHFPDTTAGHADFKESSKSSLMFCKDFADPGSRFLSGCSTETWSPPDIKESITSADKNIHFSESCKLGTTKSLADFVCDRKITQIKDKIFSPCKSLLGVNYISKKGGLLSHIPSASKMGRKHSQPPPPSVPSLSNRPNVVYLTDSDEEEKIKQRHPCNMALGGRHSRVSTITTVEIHQLFGNEGSMYNFATGKDLPDFVDYHSSASLVSCESHEGQDIFHSELDGFLSVGGSKSSHPPPINVPQNKFGVGIGVPELCLNSQTDTENVEVTEDIRNSREQSTGGAKSLIKSPLKEVHYFCGTVCRGHESKPKEVNCEPCYMTRKTYSGMVELESDCTDKAPTIRGKDLPLQHMPSSEDNTAEDNVEDSDMVLRCYMNSSELKTETSETEFVDVNDEAYLVVGPSGKILSMNTVSISDEKFDTCAQDTEVSERKPILFTHDNDGRTVADFEGFKIEIHEKTSKLSRDISSVRDDFHKSLVHISVLELDTGSHTLPYEDDSGLCATDTDLSTGSGVQTESDNRQTYTELPIIDGSIIKTSGITRDLRKYKYAFKVCSSPGPDTNTEDLCFHGAVSDRHGKSNGDFRLISVKGDKPLITDVKNLEVSESQYSTKHMPAPIFASRKYDDANTGSDYVGMSEEDTSITHNLVRHMDYSAVASMKEKDDGPFLADMLQVLPITSLASSVIKVTSSSPDMYSGIETETVDVESANGGALLGSSCIETSAPVEMGLSIEGHNVSTTHMKSSHGSDMRAQQNMNRVRGCGDICEVVTDVEEFDLTEKESPQDQPDDNIHVIDAEDQVCVCVSSEKETQNAVCVCMGKCHGQLSMEWRTSSGSSASKTSSWNATQGHEGMICLLDLSSAAASLPLSCIRADLPSMQVAAPYYNVESVGSNPLA